MYINSIENISYSLPNLFDIIQTSTLNILSNKNKLSNTEIINLLDLNITTFKKYYPIISTILKNNENYKTDLLYDFMDIRSISMYIFNYLEEINNKKHENLKPYINLIYDYLLLIDNLLDNFYRILTIKNNYISKNISKEEYYKEYEIFKTKLNAQMDYFLENIYDDNEDSKNFDIIKDIWQTEYVENEYAYNKMIF